jgi:predicted dinucleotide-binding enzyme
MIRPPLRPGTEALDHERQPRGSVSIDEAIERAGVLVFTLWLDPFRELIAYYGERLAGKVIVDPTNPRRPKGAGGYRKVGELGDPTLPTGWCRAGTRTLRLGCAFVS